MKPGGSFTTKSMVHELRMLEPSEHASQCAVIDWWDWNCKRWGLPSFALFAVPNAGAGAQKGQAGKMKAEGVRPGVPDLVLAVPTAGAPGLLIEMKRKPNKVMEEQHRVIFFLRRVGYHVVVAWSQEEAVRAITAYLGEYRFADAPVDG
jgi:hypothetical protein